MEMWNFSSFPNFRFVNTDNQGREFGVVLVKGTYDIGDGFLKVSGEQAPVLFEDVYHGEANNSSLWMPSDVVAKKPRTDIIMNAVARPPGGRPLKKWTCGIKIGGGAHRFERRLRVCGTRHWIPVWSRPETLRSLGRGAGAFRGWTLGEPEETMEVPIRYEFAYGGVMSKEDAVSNNVSREAYEYNPVGCGWIEDASPRDAPLPAPQIEAVESPPLQPMRHAAPGGFGPIPPSWLPRRPLGGTYDERWQKEVWPRWPADYDFAYNNSAPPAMIYPAYLAGDETVVLDGICSIGAIRFSLPEVTMTLGILRDETMLLKTMDLDTLFLEVADLDPLEHRVFVTWRTTFDQLDADRIALVMGTRS